ncbi:MAG: hypothetical protein ACTSXA_04570 [Candidatus Heimdallarchaeota archaeon]
MAETQLKATLIGRLETPMIVAKPFLKKNGCWLKVVREPTTDKFPLLTSVGKVVKGEQQAPTILRGYRGFVKVSCVGYNKERLLLKMNDFLMKRFLGGLTSEGFGKVEWLECEITTHQPSNIPIKKKFKIRKGLGVNYPEELKRLLIALMLHDFVDNELHKSKIYRSIIIEDEEIREACLNHHNGDDNTNKLLPLVKYYDSLASLMLRKIKNKANNRYSMNKGKINFKQLVDELEVNQHSAHKLYNYIYNSKDLIRIVESLRFGYNNLQNHLLVMVNLAINDFYNKTLKLKNGIITIKRKNYKGNISTSTSERESLFTVIDAEMHSTTSMNNANSERAPISKKRRLGT